MRKLIDGLAIASFVLSLTTVGAIGFGYLALTNKTNQEKIKNYAVNEVQKLLTNQLSKSIPSVPNVTGDVVPTGPSLPKF
jgi:secreted protein with Ig-like and vWFA domain